MIRSYHRTQLDTIGLIWVHAQIGVVSSSGFFKVTDRCIRKTECGPGYEYWPELWETIEVAAAQTPVFVGGNSGLVGEYFGSFEIEPGEKFPVKLAGYDDFGYSNGLGRAILIIACDQARMDRAYPEKDGSKYGVSPGAPFFKDERLFEGEHYGRVSMRFDHRCDGSGGDPLDYVGCGV